MQFPRHSNALYPQRRQELVNVVWRKHTCLFSQSRETHKESTGKTFKGFQ
jgi:hypothetical protein